MCRKFRVFFFFFGSFVFKVLEKERKRTCRYFGCISRFFFLSRNLLSITIQRGLCFHKTQTTLRFFSHALSAKSWIPPRHRFGRSVCSIGCLSRIFFLLFHFRFRDRCSRSSFFGEVRCRLVLRVMSTFMASQCMSGFADRRALLARVSLRVWPVNGFDVVLDPGHVAAGQPAKFAHATTIRPAPHPAPHQRRIKKIWTKKEKNIDQSFVLTFKF